jgi:hypothetical protein
MDGLVIFIFNTSKNENIQLHCFESALSYILDFLESINKKTANLRAAAIMDYGCRKIFFLGRKFGQISIEMIFDQTSNIWAGILKFRLDKGQDVHDIV